MQENSKNNATHFIEQYRRTRNKKTFDFTKVCDISDLEDCLNATKVCNLKTICIFLITPKQKP